MERILVIQTAFIGDVILATALLETLNDQHPQSEIDILVRKGNEGLLKGHPFIHDVLIWDKSKDKYANLKKVGKEIRNRKYNLLVNLQRFGSSGLLSWRSKATVKVGFKKNPFSFCYDHKVDHEIGEGKHEVERNFDLLKQIGTYSFKKPKLYPQEADFDEAKIIKGEEEIMVFAPSSVWFTKQLPANKWVELINNAEKSIKIVLLGGPADRNYLQSIAEQSEKDNVVNAAGQLSLLGSAALISLAKRTFVNDSAPLHLATSMNSPVTVFFCSTIPAFGFGPLSDDSKVIETDLPLDCRPCGLHGKKECPKGHFKCANSIEVTIS